MKTSCIAGMLFAVLLPVVTIASPKQTLIETGSSLLFPVMERWKAVYASVDPGLTLATNSTSSGAGITAAASGRATIGASDTFLPISKAAGLLNIALTISAQTVTYNLPEAHGAHLNLSSAILSGIYRGEVIYWDDPRIATVNLPIKGSLPHHRIAVIRRGDASGDTSLFTTYLSDNNAWWSKNIGSGLSVTWPRVPSEIAVAGNGSMLETIVNTPYAIGYLGISYLMQANQSGITYAALQNGSGAFILPSIDSIGGAALDRLAGTPPSESISLVDAPSSTAYPIVNYEYAVVHTEQPDPATARALRKFLLWVIGAGGGNDGGNLLPGFTHLPKAVEKLSRAQIERIR